MEILITSLRHLLFGYSNIIDITMLDCQMAEERNGQKRIGNFQVLFQRILKVIFVAIDEPDKSIRALYHFVKDNLWGTSNKINKFVDARSEEEYNGKILSPPEYPLENPQRAEHIPGAINIPWNSTVNNDGTFKSKRQLLNLYKSHGITPDENIITYCRIGERSAHTWFVLKYLLGYPNVKNYDGSWIEWRNIIGIQQIRYTIKLSNIISISLKS